MNLEEIRKSFGSKLSKMLKEKEMSAIQLAARVGIDRSNITKYLSGESSPKLDVFLKICDELETQPNYFLDFSNEDYITNKSKSDTQKIIESAFCLFKFGLLSENDDDYFRGDAPIRYVTRWYDYRPVLEEVLKECNSYATSRLVESEHICKKIIDEYEKSLEEEFKSRSADPLLKM